MERLTSHMHKKERAPQDWDNVNFFTKPVEKYINAHAWSIQTLFAEKMSKFAEMAIIWLVVSQVQGRTEVSDG